MATSGAMNRMQPEAASYACYYLKIFKYFNILKLNETIPKGGRLVDTNSTRVFPPPTKQQ
jgi:hypothetical protein